MTEIQDSVFANPSVGEADFGVRPFDSAQCALSLPKGGGSTPLSLASGASHPTGM